MTKNGNQFLSLLIKLTVTLVVLITVLISTFLFLIHSGHFGALPDEHMLSRIEHSEGSQVVDMNGKVLGRYFLLDRTSISYEELPTHLVAALVATEDARFFNHSGVDYRSFLRVLIRTILLRDRSGGGGSTITMQLAKNLFPREDFSKKGLAISKVKEAIIATRIEKLYTKTQIIALYLNTVSFPDNTYGIQAASKRFFGKHVSALSIEEAATLVGTLKATTTYNPRLSPDRSKQRRNVVLSQMSKYGELEEETLNELITTPIKLQYTSNRASDGLAPYFRAQVRKTVNKWIEDSPKEDGSRYNLYTDGLTVETTLNSGMQLMAENATRSHLNTLQQSFEREWGQTAPWLDHALLLEKARQLPIYKQLVQDGLSEKEILDNLSQKRRMVIHTTRGVEEASFSTMDSLQYYIRQLNAGFIALAPKDGAVRAWVGGRNFEVFEYDHVSQAKRQVGSTFKPFVYTAAIEQGVEPCEYFSAKAVTYEDLDGWTPSNGEEDLYEGQNLSMQTALSKSVNTVAIKVLEQAGIANVIEQARALGIESDLPKVPSLALGTASLSVQELAGAYAAYVNGQRPVKPYLVTRILNKSGEVLYEHVPETSEKAFDITTAEMMIEMMKSVVNDGTGQRLRWKYNLTNDIAGKTGTTQSNRDGWFVGITPELVAVTWVGADDPRMHFRSTKIGQGANSALPIFGQFYQSLSKDNRFNAVTLAKFNVPSRASQDRLACDPMIEDGFLKRLFADEDPDVKKFGEDTVENDGMFGKIKGLFRKKKKK